MPLEEVQGDSSPDPERPTDASSGIAGSSSSGGEDKPPTPAQKAKKLVSQIKAMERFPSPREVPIDHQTSRWIKENSSNIAKMIELTNTSDEELEDKVCRFVDSLPS